MKKELNLSPPWHIYVAKVKALFEGDSEVTVSFDEDTYTLNIVVDNAVKANAIEKLLPSTVEMGNITLSIVVIPPNEDEEFEDLVFAAFEGNPYFVDIVETSIPPFPPTVYGLFKNTTVQFYEDDISEYRGFKTVAAADLAKELIETPAGFYFSTEVE